MRGPAGGSDASPEAAYPPFERTETVRCTGGGREATGRAAVWNAGTPFIVLGTDGSLLDIASIDRAGRIGWALLLAAIATQVAVMHLGIDRRAPIRRATPPTARP